MVGIILKMIDLLQKHINELFDSYQWTRQKSLDCLKPFLKNMEKYELSTQSLDLPRLLPKMLEELIELIRSKNSKPELLALAGGIYSYVFNPFDYIQEDTLGFLGFIDDVLIVFYGMELIEVLEKEVQFNTIHNSDIVDSIKQWENILKEDLVDAFKAYPKQVAGLLTSDLRQVKVS